ncbi:fasciclin domain-containing protein [Hephaestia mangrovi]|uniref:fasciclin domain-containing protein n=1 Tax=Hephaestia mangrovi TaxID=2873268 RepID=UPI001CA7392C|nr:fasciclin domain-containing protein [Hephaestia mangrovi]
MKKLSIFALGMPLAALALAGCSGGKGTANEQAAVADAGNATMVTPSDKTLADMFGGDDLDTMGDVVKTAGLDTVLDGVGPYTVFAPTDDAFNALGTDRVDAMKQDDMKAQDAALVQAHIVPGFITAADIANAIDAGNGSARMTTMSGGTLTFTKSGDTIQVASDDGSQATLTGDEALGSNGAIHPVSALLVKSTAAS